MVTSKRQVSVRRAVGVLSTAIMAAAMTTTAQAQPETTGWSSITMLSGGWIDPFMRIALSQPHFNPAGCSLTDGYIVDAAMPGAQLLQSMLLTAYASGDQVHLTIDGCILGRPKVIGVDIRKPV